MADQEDVLVALPGHILEDSERGFNALNVHALVEQLVNQRLLA